MIDEYFMKKAISLAKKGAGKTSPNPMVGAIIVKKGKIIGKGWHKKYGAPHAEVNAILSAKENLKGSTIYVTLEPCSHTGKTPPCTERIIKEKIKKVVIGSMDTNPIAKGGAEILKNSGIEVVSGVCEKEALKLNEGFFKFVKTKTPFIILKSAITLDGNTATSTGDSKWITNEKSRRFVHKLRNEVDAIMIGRNTAEKDNPNLTTRFKKGKNSIRIVLDRNLVINFKNKNIINKKAKTIIVVSDKIKKHKKIEELEKLEIKVLKTPVKNGSISLKPLIKKLGEMEITSILVEGGGTLISSFIKEKIADKLYFFYAPKLLNGNDGSPVCFGKGIKNIKNSINLKDVSFKTFDDNFMVEAYF